MMHAVPASLCVVNVVLSCKTHVQYKAALSQWARSSEYSRIHRVAFRHVLAVMLASYPFSDFLAEPESEICETWSLLARTAV